MTKEDLQELRVLIREELKPIEERLVSVEGKIDAIQEDIDVLKEESEITRNGVNTLLIWAEKADRSINVGLYNKD
jgi:septation ring formation regulator EzrA